MHSRTCLLAIEDLLGGFLAGADAVGDAYASVAVAGEGQFRKLVAETLDAVQAFEVADAVLGHGGLPFVDAGEEWHGTEAQDLLQFVPDHGDDGVVGFVPDVFCVRSGEEAAQKGAVLGSAVGELVVNEGCGQQALAFAAGHEESEAGRERLTDFAIIAEADGDGRTVAYGC
jgi:hypothetical protein